MAFSIKLPNLPFGKSKDLIAIDIGNASIKFLILKHSGGKFTLLKWGIVPVNEGETPDLSPQDKRNAQLSRIGEFLAKEKITTKNVSTSISGHQVIVRYVKFPKLSYEELSKTILFEAEPYIPFDIKEVDISFHILADVVEDGQKKMETILVASKKEAVQGRLELFSGLSLRLVIVDADVFALANASEINSDPATSSETIMHLNVGSSITNIVIVDGGIPKVVRDIFIAGDTFTKGIQKNMGCDYNTAEELKKQHALLVTAEEKEKTLADNQKEALQVSQAITSVAKDMLAEIHRSIDFFASQNPEKSISKILLSGGTANLKNLDRYISQELKLNVEMFNPLKNINGGEIIPLEFATQLAVAVGLAARKENDNLQK
jgi:type IV pilus assembly protein PilM